MPEWLIWGGVVWFVLTVLPVAGVLFPVGIILAERTLYLPSVGLALVVAGLIRWVLDRHPTWVRPVVAVLAGARRQRQSGHHRRGEALVVPQDDRRIREPRLRRRTRRRTRRGTRHDTRRRQRPSLPRLPLASSSGRVAGLLARRPGARREHDHDKQPHQPASHDAPVPARRPTLPRTAPRRCVRSPDGASTAVDAAGREAAVRSAAWPRSGRGDGRVIPEGPGQFVPAKREDWRVS